MDLGFVKAAAVTPRLKVADPVFNGEQIMKRIDEACDQGAAIIVFPELCITGYTCQDLFLHDVLLNGAKEQLIKIAHHTEKKNAVVFVGLPLAVKGKLYNVAAAVGNGRILGLVPKTAIPNYNEFYEARHFTAGMAEPVSVELKENIIVWMGTKLLFSCTNMPKLNISAEICEDLWVPGPPSIAHAMAGATVIVNLSAGDEVTGKDVYRRELVKGQSARLLCGYIYAGAGDGESTQDLVFSGHSIISENGTILAQSKRFRNETIYSEIDVNRMDAERRRMNTFLVHEAPYVRIGFTLKETRNRLTRFVDPAPFVPRSQELREKRCEEIFMMQAMGLKKRLSHTKCKGAVVGISGGLDSTLALLVVVRAFQLLKLPKEGIIAVTMPGFGTTDRTYDNAGKLIRHLGVSFREVDIKEAVAVHFKDIGHDQNIHDITYENSQARERTQILMDIANKENGLVIGTGDMSELALGWATYNGDHMSMYGVNASVPKTLVRHLVRYYADVCEDESLREVLLDILDTPVSPELLPPLNGVISQKTEDLVGPYELHDFYLYYLLRFGFSPKKIYELACHAFDGTFENETIKKWLDVFIRRFFSQHFKRSCLPDGPKVGTVSVSPRGDLRMPSDAAVRIWLDEMKEL